MNDRSAQEEALLRLVGIFDAIGLKYMVTGSFAASLYSVPRMTRDVDIVIDPRPDDRQLLGRALMKDDFVVFQEAINEAFDRRSMFNVIDERDLVKLDIIIRDGKLDTDLVFERAIRAPLGGGEVNTISREDLIVAKLRWARRSDSAMQLRDVHQLLALDSIDDVYLASRVTELDLTDLLNEARDERYQP